MKETKNTPSTEPKGPFKVSQIAPNKEFENAKQ
jgi:hypothetical protein